MSPPEVSVVVPMYEESAVARDTLKALVAELDGHAIEFELLPVDDGSPDDTWTLLCEVAAAEPRVRPLRHAENRGRGKALRTGFAAARGRYVVTIDADLSYGPEHVVALVHALRADPELDLVLGSPYMTGGRTEGVPRARLWMSVLGNRVLARAVGHGLHTFTGILRGYRREVLRDLDLVSDGKEIHLEVLSQALAMGWKVGEVPAVLRARRAGASKFRWRRTTWSHLLHSVGERPLLFFGALGTVLLVTGASLGLLLLFVWQTGSLNPERPLMTVMLLLVLAGVQLIALGWLGTQVTDLRRAQMRMQRELRRTTLSSAEAERTRADDATAAGHEPVSRER